MKTRKPRKTPAARTSAVKSSPATPAETAAMAKYGETKRVAAMRANKLKMNKTPTAMDSQPEPAPVGKEVGVLPGAKDSRSTKSVARRTPLRTRDPASGIGVSIQVAESEEEAVLKKDENLDNEVEVPEVAEEVEEERSQNDVKDLEQEKPSALDVNDRLLVDEMSGSGVVGDEEKEKEVNEEEELRDGEDKEQHDSDPSNIRGNADEETNKEDANCITVADANEDMEDEEKVDLGEHEDEEPLENVDTDDHGEDTKASQDEERELKEIVKERKNRKEREVFIGGLDRDATEDDVRRVFEKMGEIVQIRLHKSLSTNKNKGYAFVEYAKKEYTKRALAEMKNPVIHGKRCGTAPSEDNDTLFLGNICNTWTKEAIGQKLKDYGVAGVENITLVPDIQRDGLSRGFAFVEFTCHSDAMFAYKRLQKPDVVFGHPERTAKIAFAEPLREPDPDVMAQIKSVFVDGIPPHWDEVRVREQLNGYGDIIRICLARNMSTARRKDYGFVDFSTHEAAIACINGINNAQLNDGNSKMKLKARLSNPMPKTQAVKGGLCGGFRIGRGDGGFPRYGRGISRDGNPINNAGFARDRGFYHGGRGPMGRVDFPVRSGRRMFGQEGRRGSFRGGHYSAGRGDRPNFGRQWFGEIERDHAMHYPPRRQDYSPEGYFDHRPFPGNQFDDPPYFYGDDMHGMKRLSYMRDFEPDFLEPSRIRPRLDHTDPAASFHGNQYHDGYEPGSSVHSQDYYGPDQYAGVPHSSFYGGDYPPPYGRGYYF